MAIPTSKGKKLYRSGLERETGLGLQQRGMEFGFETLRLSYIQPETNRHYTPDFVLANGIIIETKGQLDAADRKKMILIKQQYPNLDIRFVFSYARAKIYKGSKTTVAKWAAQNGYMWADKRILLEWTKEPAKELNFK